MNELLFLVQTIFTVLFAFAALRLGKECLISWVVLQGVLANIMVFKLRTFFGWTCVCSDVYAVGCVFGLNLIQEYFGKEIAQKTIWFNFFAMLFFVLMSRFQLAYTPALTDTAQASYETLLAPAPRIMAASTIAFLVGQFVNLRIFSFFRNLLGENRFALRLTLSLSITQLLDTVLFGILGLYGIVQDLGQILLIAYLIKMCVVLGSFPLTVLSKKIIKPSSIPSVA